MRYRFIFGREIDGQVFAIAMLSEVVLHHLLFGGAIAALTAALSERIFRGNGNVNLPELRHALVCEITILKGAQEVLLGLAALVTAS